MTVLKTLLAISAASIPVAHACAGAAYRPAGKMQRRQDYTATPVAGVVGASSPPSSVPLESIYASMVTVSVPMSATPTAGQQPAITNAPVLPTWTYTPGAYPSMDVTPPTDSDEVKGWVAAIDWSKVPDYTPNTANAGDSLCAVNAAASADKDRCWWSCGQCTAETDIVDCPEKDTWGITFDDGPSISTPILLDYLGDNNLKATFYVIGSRALGQPDILRQEHILGHEIGGHTWSHPALTTLTNEEIVAELGWTRKLVKDITGVTMLTFRPPQGDIDNRVRAIASQMNLQPVMWTGVSDGVNELLFDTQDFDVAAGLKNSTEAFSEWTAFLDANLNKIDNGFVSLEHDLHAVTVDFAVYHILPDALSRTNPSLSLKSVQQCHGREIAEAYLETASNLIFGNSTETSGEVVGSLSASESSSAASTAAFTGSSASAAISSSSAASAAAAAATGGNSAGFAQVAATGAVWLSVIGAGVALIL